MAGVGRSWVIPNMRFAVIEREARTCGVGQLMILTPVGLVHLQMLCFV